MANHCKMLDEESLSIDELRTRISTLEWDLVIIKNKEIKNERELELNHLKNQLMLMKRNN